MNNKLETILDKYFKDEKIKYYHVADAVQNDQYVKWDYFQHEREKILISIGSDNGETDVKIFWNSERLDGFLELIFY